MGLMDFFRKGKEKPVSTPQPQTRTQSPTSPSTGTSPGTGATRPGAPTIRDYTIQSGDSLSKIARHFYGNPNDWQKIYEANKDKIKDPNMIYPGQKIIIP
jgi:nucleoid-associated protein YgaU